MAAFFWKKKASTEPESPKSSIIEDYGEKTYNGATLKQQMTREHSRLANIQLQRLKDLNDKLEYNRIEQKIAELEAEFYDDDEEESPEDAKFNPEQMLMSMFMQKMKPASNPSPEYAPTFPEWQPQQTAPVATSSITSLDDSKIKAYIQDLLSSGAITKKQLKFFQSQDINTKLRLLESYFPTLTDDEKHKICEAMAK